MDNIDIHSHIYNHLDDLLYQKNDRKSEMRRSLKYNGPIYLVKEDARFEFLFLFYAY
jgi:hypothetical protein